MELEKKLEALRSELAQAAQAVVDEWTQDEEGFDEELGVGGACDQVSEAILSVLAEKLEGVEFTEGGQPGDDHAYTIVYDEDEAFAVDIPPSVYETGGGYSWKKRKDAKIEPDDVMFSEVERDLVADWEDSAL
jgi:hypothetical protein